MILRLRYQHEKNDFPVYSNIHRMRFGIYHFPNNLEYINISTLSEATSLLFPNLQKFTPAGRVKYRGSHDHSLFR